jgi:hypothetical protein
MPPLLKTLSVGLGGIAATVAIYSSGIIGANYTSAIVDHIIDIVNGVNTSVVLAPNSPTWSIGIQMPKIQGVSATVVSSNGTLASSTAFTFEVAAIDVQGGTTTLSDPVTANVPLYSSTSSINVQWANTPGAATYAIFFATGTVPTFNQYFYATSTNATTTQFTISTTTGSLSGTFTKLDGTALPDVFNPQGPSFLEGNSLISSTSTLIATSTALQVDGLIKAYSFATTTCDSTIDGAIFYHAKDKHLYVCESGTWQIIK